jgi:hypothetical protein
MRLLAGLLAVICLLTVMACGDETDEEQVKTAISQFAEAIEDEDPANFCLAITTTSQMALFGKDDPLRSCIETVGLAGEQGVFGANIDASSVETGNIEVNGDRATVDLAGERNMRLARVEGDWRIELSPPP